MNRMRGFATLSMDRLREISRAGGIAAHKTGKAHEWTRKEASEAGRKGGTNSSLAKRRLR